MGFSRIRKSLWEAATAGPFRPFTVSLADGWRFPVRSPEYLWIPPEAERTFVVADSTAEDHHVLDPLIASLDFVNGRPRRRKAS